LITLAIARRICAGDIGRERDVADAIEGGEEIVAAVKDLLEADAAFAEIGAGQDLGLQFVLLAEEEAFSYADLAAGANQAFPIVGIGGELASQQNLDAAAEKIMRGRIVRAQGLSVDAFAAAVEAGGKNAGVVEDHEIAGAQQVGEVAELAIRKFAAGSLQVQHAGTVTGSERFLSDEFGGKVEMEIGNQHGVRL